MVAQTRWLRGGVVERTRKTRGGVGRRTRGFKGRGEGIMGSFRGGGGRLTYAGEKGLDLLLVIVGAVGTWVMDGAVHALRASTRGIIGRAPLPNHRFWTPSGQGGPPCIAGGAYFSRSHQGSNPVPPLSPTVRRPLGYKAMCPSSAAQSVRPDTFEHK